ncbi:SIR2 family protein [Winogradskyella sp. 3972H.M.0a.05]|uniref:SIR2 family protein n=1 Tax=Winogradskyella sp. 3972H.M.0a.05 TaxID=2950277 RepID=UPI003397C5B0
MKEFSILLGAGFSKDALIPDRKLINDKLRSLKFSDFMISSVSIAYFTGENHPNSSWQNVYERKFVEFFIEKYNALFDDFDYESLYDYAMGLYKNHETSKELQEIYDEFKSEKPHYPIDKLNSISIVIRTIDQLVDSLLYFDSDIFQNGIVNKYSSFLNLIDHLSQNDYKVSIFTLNHDLLLESLLRTSLNHAFTDGFQYEFTPYYIKQGELQYRIKYYTNKYDGTVNIFKLHGSVDNYKVNYSQPFDMVKIPKKLNHINLYREKKTEDQKVTTENIWTLYESDFLTGNDTKIEKYKSHDYYVDIFTHFEERLERSSLLLILGYGLADKEINNKIFEHFDYKKNKIIVVKPSKGSKAFYRDDNIVHYGNGKLTSDITVEEIIKYLDM